MSSTIKILGSYSDDWSYGSATSFQMRDYDDTSVFKIFNAEGDLLPVSIDIANKGPKYFFPNNINTVSGDTVELVDGFKYNYSPSGSVSGHTYMRPAYCLSDDLIQNTTSTTFAFVTTSNGNITIAPHGSGRVVLDNHTWPKKDGSSGKTLSTDGAGNLSFSDFNASFSLLGATDRRLGGNLDANAKHILFDSNTGITDDSNNEQLFFTKTTAAVNYLNITNSATGNPVIIEAKGDDTNINLELNHKGTSALQPVKFGTHRLPISDGAANYVYVPGLYGGNFISPALFAATRSNIETPFDVVAGTTANLNRITPASAQYHPGVVKAWVVYDFDANTVDASYNVSSVNETASYLVVVFNTAFSSVNYSGIATFMNNGDASVARYGRISNTTTTYARVSLVESTGGAVNLADRVAVIFYGDQ